MAPSWMRGRKFQTHCDTSLLLDETSGSAGANGFKDPLTGSGSSCAAAVFVFLGALVAERAAAAAVAGL